MLLLDYVKPKKIINDDLKKFLFDNDLQNIYEDLQNCANGKNYFALSISDKSKISYLTENRIPEDENLIFDAEYRKSKAYHTRIGKVLSDNISQSDMQKVSALLHNRAFKNGIQIFLTSEIKRYYHEENYTQLFENSGSLKNSCMKDDNLQTAIGLYEYMGSNIVQLLVAVDKNDQVVARALLWKQVKKDNTIIQYLDRVYAINDNLEYMLYNYAEEKEILTYKGCKGCMSIDFEINEDHALPYFDTFKGYSFGILSNGCGDYNLEGVEGESLDRLNENRYNCSECGDIFDCENEGGYSEYNSDFICGDCGVWCNDDIYPNNQIICINKENYVKDDTENICFSDHHNEYLLLEDCVYSEYHNSYLLNDDAVFSEYHEDYFLFNEDVIYLESKKDWFLKDDENIIVIDNECYHIDNCVLIDEKWYSENDSKLFYDDITEEYKLKQIKFTYIN